MRPLLLFAIIFFGCKDEKSVETPYFRKQKIDQYIPSKARLVKECYSDSSFFERKDHSRDTIIRIFFCDSVGQLYLITKIFLYPRTEAVYLTYFDKGNVVKVEEEFSFKNYTGSMDKSEYYIDHDTAFWKDGSDQTFSNMNLWIPEIKDDYKSFDSLKRTK